MRRSRSPAIKGPIRAPGNVHMDWTGPRNALIPTAMLWKRSGWLRFTLDMTREEIYLDMTSEDLEAGFEAGFDMESFSEAIPYRRVLIGAPLWIRTPGPRAVRLYAHCDDLDDPKEDPRLALTKWLRRHGYRLATASIQKAWRTTSVPTQRNGRRTITHYCQGSDLANSSWQICTSRRPG